MPHRVQLHQKYRDQGLELVLLNMEGKEKFEEVGEMIAQLDLPVTNLCLAEGLSEEGLHAVQLEEGVLPVVHLYDRTGKLRHHLDGLIDKAQLENLLVQLLKE